MSPYRHYDADGRRDGVDWKPYLLSATIVVVTAALAALGGYAYGRAVRPAAPPRCAESAHVISFSVVCDPGQRVELVEKTNLVICRCQEPPP